MDTKKLNVATLDYAIILLIHLHGELLGQKRSHVANKLIMSLLKIHIKNWVFSYKK